jgi:hypothetical protein
MKQRNIIGTIRPFGIEKISKRRIILTLLRPVITRKSYYVNFIMEKALDHKGIFCFCFFNLICQIAELFCSFHSPLFTSHSKTYVLYLLHFIYSLCVTLFSYPWIFRKPIPVAARFKAWVCGRSLARITVSNPAGSKDVCLLWLLYFVR